MTTILEQVQIQNHPVLDTMYSQKTAMMTAQTPEKMRSTSTQVAIRKQIKNKNQVNANCNCYENETVDYRSFIQKPEFIINMGSFTIRNPLHMTPEQSKSNLKHKVARAKKNAKRARKDARKANKAAQKARAKSDKIYTSAVAARDEISHAQRMTTKAWDEAGKTEAAHVTAMKWAAFVEREGECAGDMARGVREAARGAGDKAEYCDHRFR